MCKLSYISTLVWSFFIAIVWYWCFISIYELIPVISEAWLHIVHIRSYDYWIWPISIGQFLIIVSQSSLFFGRERFGEFILESDFGSQLVFHRLKNYVRGQLVKERLIRHYLLSGYGTSLMRSLVGGRGLCFQTWSASRSEPQPVFPFLFWVVILEACIFLWDSGVSVS